MFWWWWIPLVFFLSGKFFISLLILNDSFAGQSNLGCRSLLFMTLKMYCQSLLAYKVSFEKSTDSLMGMPLLVTLCFSLMAFKILFIFNLSHFNYDVCWSGSLYPSCLGLFVLPGLACLSLFFQIHFQFLALLLLFWATLWCRCWNA